LQHKTAPHTLGHVSPKIHNSYLYDSYTFIIFFRVTQLHFCSVCEFDLPWTLWFGTVTSVALCVRHILEAASHVLRLDSSSPNTL